MLVSVLNIIDKDSVSGMENDSQHGASTLRSPPLSPSMGSTTENNQFSLSFNQDVTSLTVGTPEGYRLYNLGRLPDALDLLYQDSVTKSCKNAKMVKRLFWVFFGGSLRNGSKELSNFFLKMVPRQV